MKGRLLSLVLFACTSSLEVGPVTLINYDILEQGTKIDGVVTDELSSITYNSVDDSYYAISDILDVNKGFIEIDFSVSMNISFSLIAGHQMDPSNEQSLTTMDSESIIFIKNPLNASDSYLIVGQEGHDTYGTGNELYLYSLDGSYIKTISDELNSKFIKSNTDNNRGPEAISVDELQEYIVYTTETPLRSDSSYCSNCHRVSINSFTVNTNDVALNTEYELRYDTDVIDFSGWNDGLNGISDIVIFRGKCGNKLYGLFLERAEFDNDPQFNFDVRIYLADLSDSTNDVNGCNSLSEDNCKDIAAVQKVLLFSTKDDVDTKTADLLLSDGQFESLSIIYNVNNDEITIYDEDNIVNLVAITDNSDDKPTVFVYAEYDASNLVEGVECNIISTTLKVDEATGTTQEEGTTQEVENKDLAPFISIKMAVLTAFIVPFI